MTAVAEQKSFGAFTRVNQFEGIELPADLVSGDSIRLHMRLRVDDSISSAAVDG